MTARLNIGRHARASYDAMCELDRVVHESPVLPRPLMELVKLRASQINGCAYCVDMHSFDAREAGVADAQIFALTAWQEGPFFTAAERAALALTESMTRLSEVGERVPEEVWQQAGKHYDEEGLAALVMLVTTINAWNRICVATRMVPRSAATAGTDA